MSDPVLHIKDSYYFEVPKALLPARYESKTDFPNFWIKNDPQFQQWEAGRLYAGIEELAKDQGVEIPEFGHAPDPHDSHGHGEGLAGQWRHWQHEGAAHQNFAKPFDVYLESFEERLRADHESRYAKTPAAERPTFETYLSQQEEAHAEGVWFARLIQGESGRAKWNEVKQKAGGNAAIQEFKSDSATQWSPQTIAAYNDHLSGKILLYPQPFGDIKNLYEPEPGTFAISKFMVIELLVALIIFAVFGWVASRMRSGYAPKGRLWNLFEVFLVFIRDQIARPAIGASHDDAHGHEQSVKDDHGIGGAGIGGPPVDVESHDYKAQHKGHGHKAHDHKAHGKDHHAHHNPYAEADRFVPVLWTIFFFVLGCNLFGMLPWLGSPTAAWGATLALALVTFLTVLIGGIIKFGPVGFLANQVPGMDLPWILALFLKPMIFVIEIGGLLIKHLVLSIRLLANMVAGHLVILGLMGLAFGVQAALNFSGPHAAVPGWLWWPVAAITVLSATAFNILELFVAFLQAYVFTFLSALFIGAAVHKH